MAESLLERVKAVPRKPGVYLFRNDKAEVVYVGKATELRPSSGRTAAGTARALETRG